MTKEIVRQLDYIFRARSLAVVGASATPPKWGYMMVSTPLNTGYRGAVYPVNPREKSVEGIPCYPSVREIPGDVDLAVICVPAAAIPAVMAECAAKGVRGAVVITAGFAETGEEGRILQDEVVKIARAGGIRFVGPNCMGIWSSAARLNLSFDQSPLAGGIAFVSQSGTFGGTLAEIARIKGYGLSKFISIGNQADLEAADYLEYLGEDDDTKAIVFYMEGFRDGGRFVDAARRVSRRKPITIYKAGRKKAAARATLSHTSSIAGSDEVFDSLCRQAGVIRAYEAEHSFEMAEALVCQPLPAGRRIAVVGSGGQGVVISDACEVLGLEIPELDGGIRAELKKGLPAHAPVPSNPVDFAGALRTSLDEARVIERLAQVDYIDGIICNVPFYGFAAGAVADVARLSIEGAAILAGIPAKYGKPMVTLKWHREGTDIIQDVMKSAHIPAYDTPEQCARAMYALVAYAEIRRLADAHE
jgi:acyl-CoA synthetase (NDP forming)